MSRARSAGLLAATLTLATTGSAAALSPPHDDSNTVGCNDCHVSHGGVLLARDLQQEALCLSCHNPLGPASSMVDVALHTVDAGQRIVDCGSCHNPHAPMVSVDPHPGGVSAPNLSLVRADTGKYVAGALEPAVFQQRPDHLAFDDANAPWVGICQSCHSQTSVHQNGAGVSHQHGVGSSCTSCHPHEDGFLPRPCTDCHDLAQDDGDGVPPGGRRPVGLEFPLGASHVHDGAVTPGYRDCLVCHSIDNHQSGMVELLDPDTGAIYAFELPADLTSDPDLSDFCGHCHDADGAARLPSPLDPFGSGQTPSDVASRFDGNLQWLEWYGAPCVGAEGTLRPVNSHHDIRDADQAFSGAKIECLSCHGSHSPSPTTPLADPNDTSSAWLGSVNDFCLRCHAGGTPADPGWPAGVVGPTIHIDASGQPCTPGPGCNEVSALRPMESCDYGSSPWWNAYTWTHSAHGPDSKRGWAGYSGAPSAAMDCTVCHDPHGSVSANNPAGNPYAIRDLVDGSSFTDDGTSQGPNWTGPPWDTMGLSREVIVTVTEGANPPPNGTDYAHVDWGGPSGLCSVCHAGWEAGFHWHRPACDSCQFCHGHGKPADSYDFVNTGYCTVCHFNIPSNWHNSSWTDGFDTSCNECGNSAIDGLEQCDDGNQLDGDGCSSECTSE